MDHGQPDRVPVDFWCERSVKKRLVDHLGIGGEEGLLKRLNIDIRNIYPEYVGPELKTFPDGSYEDFWGVIRSPIKNPYGTHYEVTYSPFCRDGSLKEIDKYRWPRAEWFDYSSLDKMLQRHGDYGICVGRMGIETQTFFIQTWYMRGLEKILEDMIISPDLVDLLISKILDFRKEHVQEILKVVKGKVEWIQMADDYGTQNGLFISRDLWRRYFKSPISQLTEMIHGHNIKVFLHSCGSIRELIPDLIGAGIDILNPIQVTARGMEPVEIKKEYGDRICLHGTIDTQRVLSFGSPEDIRKDVFEKLEKLGSDGGFILATTHTIEQDIPTENILAIYDAVNDYYSQKT
jgi:uroporphyrinogen decarboxylase